jgi:hypothetical protein
LPRGGGLRLFSAWLRLALRLGVGLRLGLLLGLGLHLLLGRGLGGGDPRGLLLGELALLVLDGLLLRGLAGGLLLGQLALLLLDGPARLLLLPVHLAALDLGLADGAVREQEARLAGRVLRAADRGRVGAHGPDEREPVRGLHLFLERDADLLRVRALREHLQPLEDAVLRDGEREVLGAERQLEHRRRGAAERVRQLLQELLEVGGVAAAERLEVEAVCAVVDVWRAVRSPCAASSAFAPRKGWRTAVSSAIGETRASLRSRNDSDRARNARPAFSRSPHAVSTPTSRWSRRGASGCSAVRGLP